jgi:hypothetical protein
MRFLGGGKDIPSTTFPTTHAGTPSISCWNRITMKPSDKGHSQRGQRKPLVMDTNTVQPTLSKRTHLPTKESQRGTKKCSEPSDGDAFTVFGWGPHNYERWLTSISLQNFSATSWGRHTNRPPAAQPTRELPLIHTTVGQHDNKGVWVDSSFNIPSHKPDVSAE